MDTATISYRVADFLKKHPPFHAIADSDLLALAARGRVRFHEANEFVLWQGEPHKLHVFVIQQGTVSLWDETDGRSVLRDVRGPGDLLGIERFYGAPACLYTARSVSDVVIYSFPAPDFEQLVLTHPYARQFVEAHDTVKADFEWAREARAPHEVFLHQVVSPVPLKTCTADASVRDVAMAMVETGSHAIAIVDDAQRLRAVATVDTLLAWIAEGAGDSGQPIGPLLDADPSTVRSDATVTDGALTMAEAGAVAVTSDGSAQGQLQALVTARDIAPAFGDQPVSILRDIRMAPTLDSLELLNRRARALALRYLASAASVDWVARFAFVTDVGILKRIIELEGDATAPACWCFCGASGRGESLTRHAPQLVVIVNDERGRHELEPVYVRVSSALASCGYLSRADLTFESRFLVASQAEWRSRYDGWFDDPVRTQMYLARPLFDLRPVHGRESLWHGLEQTVGRAVDGDILGVLANDCLASLPPLTFFQDAVVEESGEQTAIFRLEHSALRPLVDVGRVFGMAAGKVLGSSTLDRFGLARTWLPEHESIFREASETLRILLWQQARVGISQGTSGSELPPAMLSRHDRHILKSGFRSILRLLEFTGNTSWRGAW